MINMDLGCGPRKKDGYIGVDRGICGKFDVIADLDVSDDIYSPRPYRFLPFKDNSVDKLFSSHVIEHLESPVQFLKEIHRICKNGTVVEIRLPHFSKTWNSCVHKRAFDSTFLNIISDQSEFSCAKLRFKIIERKLYWMRPDYPKKRFSILLTPVDWVIIFLANLNLWFAENIWCYWVGGFSDMKVRYMVIKQ